ncbi:hypothetical protein CPB84DRAFT_1748840 [Gymnopilus junonius]|uniref:Uncharacterized protein n=1 Tax=Gymnopilus junonius TaxID=109634 RepID=A0A9P5TKB9_GYMJU|nr:hypothetical protein CPB84DRAFT_1748840 [Gymnopilus junonius]
MAPNAKPSIPPIQWAANDHNLVWLLLAEIGKLKNFRVLFGKTDADNNTSGESKIAVCKRIGQVLLPHLFPEHATVVRERIRGKINDDFVKPVALRRRAANPDPNSRRWQPTMIPIDGKNLWDQIEKEWAFFPSLHSILAVRPSATPLPSPLPPTQPPQLQIPSASEAEANMQAPSVVTPPLTQTETAPIEASVKVKKLPQKRSFEDRIIELQEKTIEAAAHHEAEERALKRPMRLRTEP